MDSKHVVALVLASGATFVVRPGTIREESDTIAFRDASRPAHHETVLPRSAVAGYVTDTRGPEQEKAEAEAKAAEEKAAAEKKAAEVEAAKQLLAAHAASTALATTETKTSA